MVKGVPAVMPLGTKAPDFQLTDVVTGRKVGLADVASHNATVVMFICNHCPFVLHVQTELVRLANDYAAQGVGFAAISANDVAQYPEDGPEAMKALAQQLGYPFPYLYDETQAVAHAYTAACTPDTFVFDRDMKLVYRGQLDDTRPGGSVPANGKDVRDALDNLVAGKTVNADQKHSVGCGIKWKE